MLLRNIFDKFIGRKNKFETIETAIKNNENKPEENVVIDANDL